MDRIQDEAFRLYKLYWLIDNGGDEYGGMDKEDFLAGPYRSADTILHLFERINKKNAPRPYVSWVRAWIAEMEDDALPADKMMSVSVDDIGLSYAAVKALKDINVKTIGQLSLKTTGELKKRIGRKYASETIELLDSFGIVLSDNKKQAAKKGYHEKKK